MVSIEQQIYIFVSCTHYAWASSTASVIDEAYRVMRIKGRGPADKKIFIWLISMPVQYVLVIYMGS
jgi:hypothetical protein